MFVPIKENLKVYQGSTFRKSWIVQVGEEIIEMDGKRGCRLRLSFLI